MDRIDYTYLKLMFTSFGKDLLDEFKKDYDTDLNIDILQTNTSKEDIIKHATKCFKMYIAVHNNSTHRGN